MRLLFFTRLLVPKVSTPSLHIHCHRHHSWKPRIPRPRLQDNPHAVREAQRQPLIRECLTCRDPAFTQCMHIAGTNLFTTEATDTYGCHRTFSFQVGQVQQASAKPAKRSVTRQDVPRARGPFRRLKQAGTATGQILVAQWHRMRRCSNAKIAGSCLLK